MKQGPIFLFFLHFLFFLFIWIFTVLNLLFGFFSLWLVLLFSHFRLLLIIKLLLRQLQLFHDFSHIPLMLLRLEVVLELFF